jgi:hypothetical protein
MIGVQAMDQNQTDWATVHYYVATLWALVGDDFSDEWNRWRHTFDQQLLEMPPGHETGAELRAALEALQARVDAVAEIRARTGASRAELLVPVFPELLPELEKFAAIVDRAVRPLHVDSGDEWAQAVDQVRTAVCEMSNVWVSPLLASTFRDAIAYIAELDLNTVARHAR